MDSVGALLELRLLGGEPFLCKDIDRIINEYVGNKKIRNITIYTNSTLIPSEKVLEAMDNSKVSVHMSDYGQVSSKLAELDRILLSKKKIKHYIHEYKKWFDVGGVV